MIFGIDKILIIYHYERNDLMSTKSVIGCVAAGAIVGAIAGMMIDPINDKQHKKIHKCANNMFKTIGTIMDELVSM